MCGILAYCKKDGLKPLDIQSCLNSLQRIKHRGPDGEGIVLINSSTGVYKTLRTAETPVDLTCTLTNLNEVDGEFYDILLGHRRLSIFDTSSAGHQPMLQKNTGNWIVFNGEIYNFIEIRAELLKNGYSFETNCDTEVILSAYDFWKEDCLNKFNGMWAIVIWDNTRKKLFVSRDRYGIKPVYYHYNQSEALFVSEIKQILDFKNIDKSYNIKNVDLFIEYGYLDYDNTTFYENVRRFENSFYGFINTQSSKYYLETNRFYTIPHFGRDFSNINKTEDEFREIFTDSVRLRMRSDVPIGVGISGGVDSSSIVYTVDKLLGHKTHGIHTFSAVFPGMPGDESEYINFINDDLKTISHTTNPLHDFSIEEFRKLMYIHDSPVNTTSFYAAWKVSQLVQKNNIKVLLVGQGADETFAGYHHHFYKYCRSLIFKGNIVRYIQEINAYSKLKGLNSNLLHSTILKDTKLKLFMKLHLQKMEHKLSKLWNDVSSLEEALLNDFSIFQLPFFLHSEDRVGMASSVESRFPFMDYRLVEFAMNLPDTYKINKGWQKWIIRHAIDYVPDNIRFRKDKKGFTTPEKEWEIQFKADLLEMQKVADDKFPHLKGKFNSMRKYALGAWVMEFDRVLKQVQSDSNTRAISEPVSQIIQCSKCVLDTHDDSNLTFNSEGVCQYCQNYENLYVKNKLTDLEKSNKFNEIISEIKVNRGRKYDCILGISGGVDSTYVAYLCKEHGLNPLLVHFDNGWNSELAVKNIEKILQYTGFDLYTYVVDWDEFRELQLAYIRSGVLDWEIPTDHGFLACLYRKVIKHDVKYILTGHNYQTEGILPKSMRWSKLDTDNIIDINQKYGKAKLNSFPMLSFWRHLYIDRIRNVKQINILHYAPYNKDVAKKIIIEKMGWRDYGGKHYESIFTRFYQGYVLPEKYQVDKRKAHFSTLINSGQMTKIEALEELKKNPYPSLEMLNEDKEFVIKKLRLSSEEFEQIMRSKPVSHLNFKSYETGLYRNHERFMQRIKPLTSLVNKILNRKGSLSV